MFPLLKFSTAELSLTYTFLVSNIVPNITLLVFHPYRQLKMKFLYDFGSVVDMIYCKYQEAVMVMYSWNVVWF